MDIQSLLAVAAIFAIIMGIFTHFFNKRIDDLRELFKAELNAKLTPINQTLHNHVTDTDKKIETLQKDVSDLKQAVLKIANSVFKKS